jgi:hypothetical protein
MCYGIEKAGTRSHSAENSLFKMLWTCRKANYAQKINKYNELCVCVCRLRERVLMRKTTLQTAPHTDANSFTESVHEEDQILIKALNVNLMPV